MGGKSTYLRQVALITLLAQIGSFVPATEADVGLVDRIFTRVGASDNLVGGDSTFMVEMRETAAILANLTPRSLVILDEIGRGTSTFDGISIAWAVAEHLHDASERPRTLFATHYHELTALAAEHPRVRNLSVAVAEWKGTIVFLRQIVPGPAPRSYGLEVAALAGVPASVVTRARALLARLETGEAPGDASGPRAAVDTPGQLSLFGTADAQLRSELAALDPERLTPLDALAILARLVEHRHAALFDCRQAVSYSCPLSHAPRHDAELRAAAEPRYPASRQRQRGPGGRPGARVPGPRAGRGARAAGRRRRRPRAGRRLHGRDRPPGRAPRGRRDAALPVEEPAPEPALHGRGPGRLRPRRAERPFRHRPPLPLPLEGQSLRRDRGGDRRPGAVGRGAAGGQRDAQRARVLSPRGARPEGEDGAARCPLPVRRPLALRGLRGPRRRGGLGDEPDRVLPGEAQGERGAPRPHGRQRVSAAAAAEGGHGRPPRPAHGALDGEGQVQGPGVPRAGADRRAPRRGRGCARSRARLPLAGAQRHAPRHGNPSGPPDLRPPGSPRAGARLRHGSPGHRALHAPLLHRCDDGASHRRGDHRPLRAGDGASSLHRAAGARHPRRHAHPGDRPLGDRSRGLRARAGEHARGVRRGAAPRDQPVAVDPRAPAHQPRRCWVPRATRPRCRRRSCASCARADTSPRRCSRCTSSAC